MSGSQSPSLVEFGEQRRQLRGALREPVQNPQPAALLCGEFFGERCLDDRRLRVLGRLLEVRRRIGQRHPTPRARLRVHPVVEDGPTGRTRRQRGLADRRVFRLEIVVLEDACHVLVIAEVRVPRQLAGVLVPTDEPLDPRLREAIADHPRDRRMPEVVRVDGFVLGELAGVDRPALHATELLVDAPRRQRVARAVALGVGLVLDRAEQRRPRIVDGVDVEPVLHVLGRPQQRPLAGEALHPFGVVAHVDVPGLVLEVDVAALDRQRRTDAKAGREQRGHQRLVAWVSSGVEQRRHLVGDVDIVGGERRRRGRADFDVLPPVDPDGLFEEHPCVRSLVPEGRVREPAVFHRRIRSVAHRIVQLVELVEAHLDERRALDGGRPSRERRDVHHLVLSRGVLVGHLVRPGPDRACIRLVREVVKPAECSFELLPVSARVVRRSHTPRVEGRDIQRFQDYSGRSGNETRRIPAARTASDVPQEVAV